MNSTLFPAISDASQTQCVSLLPLLEIFLYFCLPLTLASSAVFIIPAVMFLMKTPKHKNGRFKIELEMRKECNVWSGQDKMKVKLVGIRRGDTDECSEYQWKEFDDFSDDKMGTIFGDGNDRFKELTAACFVLPRENSDVLEQCEKCIETCIVKDLRTGSRYKYNTSSRLSSFSPTTADSFGPEHRVVFVRLHKIGSNVDTAIRSMFRRCGIFLKIVFQSYWSMTSPFLSTHRKSLTHFDRSMILVSKVLFVVVTVSMLQVFVPSNRMPFRHYFRNIEYTLRDFTLNGDDLYISIVAALLSFVGSMPVEIFIRLISFISAQKYSTRGSITKEQSTLTCSKKDTSVGPDHFEQTSNNSFQLKATFKNVVEELKAKFASIGLRSSYSKNSRSTSVSSHNAQSSGLKQYGTLQENNTTSLGKEKMPLEYVSKYKMQATQGTSHDSGQSMSFNASMPTATVPYKRKDHIYAEISDNFIAINHEQRSSSASEDQEAGEKSSQTPCPPLIILAMGDQNDPRQNWPGDSFDHYLTEIHDPAVLMDIDPTKIKFKKDCRHSRYKGANQNSSCAADPSETSGSLESTHVSVLEEGSLAAQIEDATKKLKQGTCTKETVDAFSKPQKTEDMKAENLTWHKTESAAMVNNSCCHQHKDRIYLKNLSSHSPNQTPIALVVEGEYKQFARGDGFTTSQGEDTSKMVKYRDVLSRGMRVRKAFLVRGKNYIDNFRDMSKAMIRSLSLSSAGDESATSSEKSGQSSVTMLPDKVSRKRSSSEHSINQTQSVSLHKNRPTEARRNKRMAKIVYHGVTIAQPEEENTSILYKLKLWLSNIFVNTKTRSDKSDSTDTDVGCLANMTNKDVPRRQIPTSESRKHVVSETFTHVTMDSALLDEPLYRSASSISERDVMPDILQSSIFKGVAGNLPFQQPSFQSASHEEVWRTSPEIQGKRKPSQNRNNNMNKMTMSSSSSSSFQDDKKLHTELIHLLANPFPEIGDDTSSVAPNSSSSRTILEQLDKVAPWQSSSTTSRSPSPEPKPLNQIFQPEEKKIAHKHLKLQKQSCLDKVVFLFSLFFCISAIVCSTYCVSFLCRDQLKHLWVLIVLSTVTLLVGFDLLKAFVISATHLACFACT